MSENEASSSPERLLPELFTASRWSELAAALRLTPRHKQIARLICRGCNKDDIGKALSISGATVRMHTHGLFRRLNVHVRIGVVVQLVLLDRKLMRTERKPTKK
ncbi:MAG: response regulator transcription factor [Planctomycetes bacterium]|nr:response regulator transcription factor [Planctomycetota bacterium]MBI3833397.1 response regulator transcription factor [Planctomycetota bacterium]